MRIVPNWDKYIELAPTEEARALLIENKELEERRLQIEKELGQMGGDAHLKVQERGLHKRLKEMEETLNT